MLGSYGEQISVLLERKDSKLNEEDWTAALLAERESLCRLLGEMDKDHNGKISKLEFRKGVAKLGIHAPRLEVHELFDLLDDDKNGFIELDELNFYFDQQASWDGPVGMRATRAAQAHLATPGAAPLARARASHSQPSIPEQAPASPGRDDEFDPDLNPDLPRPGIPIFPADEEEGEFALFMEGTPARSEGADENGARAMNGDDVEAEVDAAPMGAERSFTSFQPDLPRKRTNLSKKLARAVELEAPASFANRRLMRQTTKLRLEMRHKMREDLGKSWWWSFKTFKLYPCLAYLRHLDEPARFLFPLGYGIYVLQKISEVDAFSQ